MENLKIKSLADIDKINYSRDGDAALDLRASGVWIIDLDSEKKEIVQDEYELKPNERVVICTGIVVAVPKGCYGSVRDRSGLAFNHGLHTLAGVLDENYRGELRVIIVNLGSRTYKLTKNERIAQLIIMEYKKVNVEYVDELDDTNRGNSAYGSSGKH
ncbi:MAG: dUTP diphosphatase [Nanoarchaeota archaeon]